MTGSSAAASRRAGGTGIDGAYAAAVARPLAPAGSGLHELRDQVVRAPPRLTLVRAEAVAEAVRERSFHGVACEAVVGGSDAVAAMTPAELTGLALECAEVTDQVDECRELVAELLALAVDVREHRLRVGRSLEQTLVEAGREHVGRTGARDHGLDERDLVRGHPS